MRGFFGAIPAGIEEAASIDGASRMRILLSIVLPLTAPGIAAAAIFSFVWSWTEYMFASAFFVDEGRDRKSTRLNSSHANISYAVSCLKTKPILFGPRADTF